ncbi:MAG: hypothetical protein M9958_00535 [Chitinophagales bacterium]|nr:hypothetical protein [Chitinophagales bacterium]
MNTLDTSKLGGHPLYLQDVGFVQNAYKEAIDGITSSLGADCYILTGCVKSLQSAGVWAISEGYVVLDKEVFKVSAHTVSFLSESDPLFWSIHQQYIEPSPVLYKESGSQNVHIQRRAIVSVEVSDFVYELPTVSILADRLSRNEFIDINTLNSWSGTLEYRTAHGMLHLNGLVYVASPDINDQGLFICEIPLKYLPYFYNDVTYGSAPPSILSYNFVNEYGAHQFVINRIVRRVGYNDIIEPVVAELYANLSEPVNTRKGYLLIKSPGVWPAGTEFVVYKFSGVSWLIAPQ